MRVSVFDRRSADQKAFCCFNVVYFKLVYGRTYHNGRPCLSNCHLGLLSGHLQNNPVLKHQRGEQRDARVDPVRFGLVGRISKYITKVRAVALLWIKVPARVRVLYAGHRNTPEVGSTRSFLIKKKVSVSRNVYYVNSQGNGHR